MRYPTHVVHLHTSRDWGGGEYQLLHLVRHTVACGLRTTLLTPPGGALFERARKEQLPVQPLPSAGLLVLLLTRADRLCCRLWEVGADILHAHDSGAVTIGAIAGRRLSLPVVLSRRIASPLRRSVLSRFKYSPRSLRAVIAISETVRGVMIESGYPADRIYVVPSGLDFAALDAVRPAADVRRACRAPHLVVGIGKLSTKKNWDFLLQAAAAVARGGGPEIDWLLVGEGPERSRLQRRVHELDLGRRVRFLGFRRDAQAILKAADLLFFPSLREGASVTVREAMAMGTPVVAVNSAGVAESLDGHGWLVSPGDVDAAALAVRTLLGDPERRERMGQAAKQSARARFSFDETIGGTLAVYERVLAGFGD